MTLAKELEAYVSGLTISQGRFAGQPFKVLPWQRRFLKGAFREGVQSSALTLARSGGKTTFVAAIAAATVDVDAPLVANRAENIIVASSFEQGMIAFRHVLSFLEPTFKRWGVGKSGRYRVQDSANRASIVDTATGAMLRCVGSDPARAFGLAPRLVLADELASWPSGNIGRMISALSTSLAKIEDAKIIYLGTRAAHAAHPFEKMLRPGGSDYVQVHCADAGDNPFSKATWRKANPGIDYLVDQLADLRKESARAKRDAEKMASFKALKLNMGVSDVMEAWLLSPGVWQDIEDLGADRIGPHFLGIDLGENASMTCAAGYWPDTGRLEVLGCFPEDPPLIERGHGDGVAELYVRAHERGELYQAGEKVVDVGEFLRLALDSWGRPQKIIIDTWRESRLREELVKAGFPPTSIETRRMGWKDGSEDVRAFRDGCLDGHVHPYPSLLMRSAIAEARVVMDHAGNSKLTKFGGGRRRNARDDAAAAAILAVAAGRRVANRPAAGPPSLARV